MVFCHRSQSWPRHILWASFSNLPWERGRPSPGSCTGNGLLPEANKVKFAPCCNSLGHSSCTSLAHPIYDFPPRPQLYCQKGLSCLKNCSFYLPGTTMGWGIFFLSEAQKQMVSKNTYRPFPDDVLSYPLQGKESFLYLDCDLSS